MQSAAYIIIAIYQEYEIKCIPKKCIAIYKYIWVYGVQMYVCCIDLYLSKYIYICITYIDKNKEIRIKNSVF